MIDSQALVYHGAAAAARLHETAELAQKGSEKGRKAEEGKPWGALEGGACKAPSPPAAVLGREPPRGVARGLRGMSVETEPVATLRRRTVCACRRLDPSPRRPSGSRLVPGRRRRRLRGKFPAGTAVGPSEGCRVLAEETRVCVILVTTRETRARPPQPGRVVGVWWFASHLPRVEPAGSACPVPAQPPLSGQRLRLEGT